MSINPNRRQLHNPTSLHSVYTLVNMSDEEDILRLSELQVSSHDSKAPEDRERSRLVGSIAGQDAREEALRAELTGVHQINTVIEGVVASLEKAKDNMEVASPSSC